MLVNQYKLICSTRKQMRHNSKTYAYCDVRHDSQTYAYCNVSYIMM